MKQKLIDMAKEARNSAYAPYSRFKVGAALLCGDGSIYTGCNIENASFTPTVCAERVAFFKALSDGKRDFCAIAVYGASDKKSDDKTCYPCGVCRQVMAEFCKGDFVVYCVGEDGVEELCLSQILPYGFGKEDVGI